ncbi:MAG TPA: glutathionylspermidine synthase family protein [Allocoleopsis sp.]
MSFNQVDFYKQHHQLFSQLGDEKYVCFDVLMLDRAKVKAIQQAARSVWQVLLQAGEVMKTLSDSELLDFGYPVETFDVIRLPQPLPFIARCDFAVTENGIYLLECNAEVATFIVETFRINGIVANHFGVQDVNRGAVSILKRELNKYLKTAAKSINKKPEHCHIVFSSLSEAPEDIATVEYLRALCAYEATFCPIEAISMDETGAYDQNDRQIDIAYRLYPTEWMVEDKDPTSGVALWDVLELLILNKKLALVNPMSAFVLQNKALMALITQQWGQDSSHPLANSVKRHFLPTYLDADSLDYPYVAKPTYGREGMEVEIIRQSEDKLYNRSTAYAAFPKIYQEFVELPTVELGGSPYTLQFSCFLVNGVPIGLGARVGDVVIDNTSSFLALGYS